MLSSERSWLRESVPTKHDCLVQFSVSTAGAFRFRAAGGGGGGEGVVQFNSEGFMETVATVTTERK